MKFIGIDPGLTGSIAVLQRTKATVYDIPVIEEVKNRKRRNKYNLNALVEIFKSFDSSDCVAVIEKSTAMPGQGVISMHSIGYGSGMYEAFLSMQYIKYERVPPQKWQKEFSIGRDTKGQAFEIAARLFPEIQLTTPRGRVLDGRCDALLLAEYCRRIFGGR